MRVAEINRLSFSDRSEQLRHPFVFWPLIRFSLSASRTHHRQHGEARALQRSAFIDELPPAITARAGKRGEKTLTTRYDFDSLAGRVLDSPLCQHGVVNRGKVDRGMREPMTEDFAGALVTAAGIAEWMDEHELSP